MRTFQKTTVAVALSALALTSANAQDRRKSDDVFGASPKDIVLSTASDWGGQGGVYTCEQWKAYLTRLFNQADVKRHGYIDEREFGTIRRASPLFERAEFGFFGADAKGRISRQSFIGQRGMFFARYDRKGSCSVTSAELATATAAEQKSAPTGFSGGRGGRGGGGGGGGFGGMSLGGVGGRF
ncbi:EF-hand domain-containing protein [Methylocella sp. CPCC 101449]|uniref:EF-hand domain-containing protein n=1 Tax=Methylocella sp. CPCC 101449 TaxID=2987531 RepID=UPI00288D5538|nr:EF-hand domain-containing protein [Methylocella sp. CPCC 101449]MDT2021804.1 EF-hand domain-containing protein [Methylocella sp. CPCC 101449]